MSDSHDDSKAAAEPKRHSFKSLLAEPKGKLEYSDKESFLLHVFWQAPSIEAAEEILSALQQMAIATMRDTPCVPCYFFRLSRLDYELCAPIRKVSDNIHLNSIFRKKRAGVPAAAIAADLKRLGYDSSLQDLSSSDLLPANLHTQPVTIEFTEIYLDERCFMEHAGSRDYLDNHAVLMNPALHSAVPTTLRLGTPSDNIIEKILEPCLKELVVPMKPGDCIWRSLTTAASDRNISELSEDTKEDISNNNHNIASSSSTPFFGNSSLGSSNVPFLLSIDANTAAFEAWSHISQSFKSQCSTCVSFDHPLRATTGEDCTRLLAILPKLPTDKTALESLKVLCPIRVEIHAQILSIDEVHRSGVINRIVEAFQFLEVHIDGYSLGADLLSSAAQPISSEKQTARQTKAGITSAGYIMHPKSDVVKPL